MKINGIGLVILAFILASASCGPFQTLDSRSKLIAARKDGLIRGATFDISPDSIKKLEQVIPVIDQETYVGYSFVHEDYPTETLRVDYMFNEDKRLDIIAIDYRTHDVKAIKEINENLRWYFQKQYGDGRKDEYGWSIWDFKDTIGLPGTIEIVLLSENNPDYQGVKLELVKYFEGE